MTDVTTPTEGRSPAAPSGTFPRLTVADVERLTDEAVAVTFAVPPELADEFRFEPGQHLTLRAIINGEEVRQSYSICQSRATDPAGRRLRVAAARVPEGRMSNWLNDVVAAGDVRRGHDPAGMLHVRDPAQRHTASRRDRGRLRASRR